VTRVLVVDDDPALQRVLRLALRGLDYEVVGAVTGRSGLSEAALHRPDVIVLDLGLPDMDGVDVCRRIREWTDTPIIVLSADATEQRKVDALDLGADDYVTKPFSMSELEARLRVALRRRPDADAASAVLTVGPLVVDVAAHAVQMAGTPVELTRKEFQILAFLAAHPGKVITHKMLLDAVWGPGFGASARYLREYAYRLRRKLGDEDGRLIVSRPGIGYQLVPPEDAVTPPGA
jgi:two-component system KDP operon response regulator KdpE